VTVPFETLIRSGPAVRLVAERQDSSRHVRELPHVLSVLGCDAGCDVVLASDQVEDVHTAIARLSGGTYLCDLGALSGTSLNRRRIRWSRLAAGDSIGVGPFTLGIEMEDRADVAPQGLPIFSLRNDQEIGVVSSIDPVLIIGSDPGCDVVLQGRSVLPRHCIVIWTEEGPIVRDLLRRELTRLNGTRVNMGRLMHGDAIGVGPYEFFFETEIDTPLGRESKAPGGRSQVAVSKQLRDETLLVSGRLPLEQVEAARDLWPGPGASSLGPGVILRDRPLDDDLDGAFLAEPSQDVAGQVEEELPAIEEELGEKLPAAEEIAIADAGHEEQAEQAEMLAALEASLDVEAPEPLPDMEEIDSEVLSEPPIVEDEATVEPTDHSAELPSEAAAEEATADKEIAMANDSDKADADVSSEKPPMQDPLHKRAERLDSKTDELRRRVAAAQAALDERASKHRTRLEEERGRLERRRADLRRQASALLQASGGQPSSDDKRPVDDIVPSQAQIESLLSGEVELTEAMNNRATTSRLDLPEPAAVDTSAGGQSLEQRAAELINVAKRERQEIEKGESLIESLRFETERRRASLTRRREKLEQRDTSVQKRFNELEKDRAAIAKERAPLEAQLQRLDAEDRAVQSRIGESRRLREDLDREADELRLEQEKLEKRRRELLSNLEAERHRLQTRQAELHRKAAELAEAAREKRSRVEEEMSKRQSAIQVQEVALRAQRQEIEDPSRRELERTATELEQVLQVRLNDIDDELVSRKADLDARVEEVFGSIRPLPRERLVDSMDSIEAPLREIADALTSPGRLDDVGTRRGLRLDGLGMSTGSGRQGTELRMDDEAEADGSPTEEEAMAVGSGDGDTAAKATGGSKKA